MYAVVQCRLMRGGATDVLKDILINGIGDQHIVSDSGKNTQVRIFTLFRDSKNLPASSFGQNVRIVTVFPAWINNFIVHTVPRIPLLRGLLQYRNFMPLFPLLLWILGKKLSRYSPDCVLVSSFAVAKNISLPPKTTSILYLHSPMQYIWTHYDEYCQQFSCIKRRVYQCVSKYLRKRDQQPKYFDTIFCNSEYTRRCAHDIYGRPRETMQVAYPRLSPVYTSSSLESTHDYFLFVGRVSLLIRHLDDIIHACNTTKTNLLILGDGPDIKYCKKIAGPTIVFTGRVSDPRDVARLIARSRGLINIAIESYGLNTAQALALGVPVIVYREGGSLELVQHTTNAVVLLQRDSTSLAHILQNVSFSPQRKNTCK